MSIQKNNLLFGLPNKGNTCYINTAVQTIIQIFSDFFISGEYYKKLSSNEKIIEFMSDFAHLVASIQNIDGRWKKTHVNLYLQNVIKYLSSIDDFKRFIKYNQEDSYDFLVQIITLLSDYLSYKINIEIDVKVEKKDLDKKDQKRLIFYNFLKNTLKTTSIIDEYICGYFRATLKCAYNDCENISEKFEPFLSLSLPIENMNTLDECLKKYISPNKLDKNNMWYCDKCKRRSEAEKKMSIWSTSKYLIISYKRYINLNITSVKDDRIIKAPFHSLDLSSYVEDNKYNENIYDLCAVTIHSGNMNNGHYIIYRKINNLWFLFNDETVIPVKECDVDSGLAYYMVYKKRNISE